MCRNIKTLYNLEPPVTDEEIREASLQYVRKVSGFRKPSKVNETVFLEAVDKIAAVSRDLLHSLKTSATSKIDGTTRKKSYSRKALSEK